MFPFLLITRGSLLLKTMKESYLKLAIIFRCSSSRLVSFSSGLLVLFLDGSLFSICCAVSLFPLGCFSSVIPCFCFHELWELFRAIANFTRPLLWSIAFFNLTEILNEYKSGKVQTSYLKFAGFILACSEISFFFVFSSASLVMLVNRLANFSLFTAPSPIPLNLFFAFITRLTTCNKKFEII